MGRNLFGVRPGVCKKCRAFIVFDKLLGKSHPFDPDTGVSHFDTCPQARDLRGGFRRPAGLSWLGDVDTFYKERWRRKFAGEASQVDVALLDRVPLADDLRTELAGKLAFVGSPCWGMSYADLRGMLGTALRDHAGFVRAVEVDRIVSWRLRQAGVDAIGHVRLL